MYESPSVTFSEQTLDQHSKKRDTLLDELRVFFLDRMIRLYLLYEPVPWTLRE